MGIANLALRSILAHARLTLARLKLIPLEEFSPGMSLDEIKSEYADTLYSAMTDYLDSGQPITSFRNAVRRAVNDGFTLAFYAGYADAGGSGEIPEDAISWLSGRIESEIEFTDGLFADLKALRADKESREDDKLSWARARASGYTGTLTGVYAQGKTWGDENIEGEWVFGDTDHCDTCADLNGQKHPLKWYREEGYIPQEAGSVTLDCGGWKCQCRVLGPDGEQLLP